MTELSWLEARKGTDNEAAVSQCRIKFLQAKSALRRFMATAEMEDWSGTFDFIGVSTASVLRSSDIILVILVGNNKWWCYYVTHYYCYMYYINCELIVTTTIAWILFLKLFSYYRISIPFKLFKVGGISIWKYLLMVIQLLYHQTFILYILVKKG